jgi:hypothetical protein
MCWVPAVPLLSRAEDQELLRIAQQCTKTCRLFLSLMYGIGYADSCVFDSIWTHSEETDNAVSTARSIGIEVAMPPCASRALRSFGVSLS